MEKEEAKGAVVIEEEGEERTATAAPEAAKPRREAEDDDDARATAAAEEADPLATTPVKALDANWEDILILCLGSPGDDEKKKHYRSSSRSTDPVSTLAHGLLCATNPPPSTLGDAMRRESEDDACQCVWSVALNVQV